MTVDQAIDYALGVSELEAVVDSGPLSRRQREVAALVAAGLTNREIAERLFIAERSGQGHAERIRNKLGVRPRTEAAAWAVEHGLTLPVSVGKGPVMDPFPLAEGNEVRTAVRHRASRLSERCACRQCRCRRTFDGLGSTALRAVVPGRTKSRRAGLPVTVCLLELPPGTANVLTSSPPIAASTNAASSAATIATVPLEIADPRNAVLASIAHRLLIYSAN